MQFPVPMSGTKGSFTCIPWWDHLRVQATATRDFPNFSVSPAYPIFVSMQPLEDVSTRGNSNPLRIQSSWTSTLNPLVGTSSDTSSDSRMWTPGETSTTPWWNHLRIQAATRGCIYLRILEGLPGGNIFEYKHHQEDVSTRDYSTYPQRVTSSWTSKASRIG
jgi:hypothetical protein